MRPEKGYPQNMDIILVQDINDLVQLPVSLL